MTDTIRRFQVYFDPESNGAIFELNGPAGPYVTYADHVSALAALTAERDKCLEVIYEAHWRPDRVEDCWCSCCQRCLAARASSGRTEP